MEASREALIGMVTRMFSALGDMAPQLDGLAPASPRGNDTGKLSADGGTLPAPKGAVTTLPGKPAFLQVSWL